MLVVTSVRTELELPILHATGPTVQWVDHPSKWVGDNMRMLRGDCVYCYGYTLQTSLGLIVMVVLRTCTIHVSFRQDSTVYFVGKFLSTQPVLTL